MAPRPLAELAQQCVAHLEEQRLNVEFARERAGRTDFRFYFYDSAHNRLQQHVSDLSKWEQDVGDASESGDNQSSDEAVVAAQAATKTLKLIEEHAASIDGVLRPGHEASLVSNEEKDRMCNRLNEAIDQVKKSIETLQRSSIVLRSHEKREQKAHIYNVRHEFDRMKDYFVSRIRNLSVEERRNTFSVSSREFRVRFEKLPWFWAKLPVLNKRIQKGDIWPDPLDGYIIPEFVVANARTVLSRFKDAWFEANNTQETSPSDEDKLNKFDALPKIAMVLSLTGKQYLFNKFIEAEVYDAEMDRDPYPGNVDLGQDASFIGAQYSRTRDPKWHEGDHYSLLRYETLPLKRVESYSGRPGGFSRVFKVQDLWHEGITYACKEMVAEPGAQHHMKTEVRNLKEICQVDHGHHLVKYVKSYERCDPPDIIMGVLLEPYADSNLNDLLKHYCREPAERSKHRSSLLRSLGCLTYSLCYLHNVVGYRHRDVKPQNILYVAKSGEFMWSDFGLAYKFSSKDDSKTYDPTFRATPQYEAPEIDNTESREHGRSADIFSLGCVFLEIISVLLPPNHASKTAIPFQSHYNYKDHIPQIEQWIESKKDATRNVDRLLNKLLDICSHMVKKDPRERWKVGKIAESLAKVRDDRNSQMFCSNCVAKYRRDSSRNYIHKDIFKHQKRTGETNSIAHRPFGGFLDRYLPNSQAPRRP